MQQALPTKVKARPFFTFQWTRVNKFFRKQKKNENFTSPRYYLESRLCFRFASGVKTSLLFRAVLCDSPEVLNDHHSSTFP